MKTIPIYLDNPYQTEMDAEILDAFPEREGVFRLILSQTIFYPMGGDQPTDQGTLIFEDGSIGEVYQVLLKEGEIQHYVKVSTAHLTRTHIHGKIDWERRFKNMKVHSAAHVIDFALYLLGFIPQILHPLKEDQEKKPHRLYEGTLKENILEKLQQKINELLQQSLKFSWSFMPMHELKKEAIYLQPGLPINKPLRSLILEGVGTVADDGMIVSSTDEIGPIQIAEIDTIDNTTRIRYIV